MTGGACPALTTDGSTTRCIWRLHLPAAAAAAAELSPSSSPTASRLTGAWWLMRLRQLPFDFDSTAVRLLIKGH